MIRQRPIATHVKEATPGGSEASRVVYVWLGLGILFFAFGTVKWTIPLAAWIYPVFFLRFVRTNRPLRGILILSLAIVLTLIVELPGYLPLTGVLNLLAPIGLALIFGIVTGLPYLIDRLVAPRLGGILSTLVFPVALTTTWYLSALVNPFGSFGNPAYTQYGDLPLLQLLSVTGLWGVDLLMGWFASLANWAWEQRFAWSIVRPGLLAYVGLLVLVFIGGEARLEFFAPQGPTVRVAGITASRTAPLPPEPWDDEAQARVFFDGTATEAQRQAVRPLFAAIDNDLLNRAQQEAAAGAKVVVWPELDALVLQEDEAAFLQEAQAVARQSAIYLDMGLWVILPPSDKVPFGQDVAVLIDPSGRIISIYKKTHIVPEMETSWQVPGDGRLPVVSTPYGMLSTAICYDADFPATILQAGRANVDILLRPTGDWKAVDPLHAQMVTYRGIENGFSVVDQAKDGLSIASDYEGNVVATSDYFTTDPQVMVAHVPMKGVRTIYSVIGDLFAWLSIAGLIVLVALGFRLRI